jgi:hypothetical protein
MLGERAGKSGIMVDFRFHKKRGRGSGQALRLVFMLREGPEPDKNEHASNTDIMPSECWPPARTIQG